MKNKYVKSTPIVQFIIGPIFVVVGIILIGVLLTVTYLTDVKYADGISATATITEIRRSDGGDHNVYIEYTTQDGDTVNTKLNSYWSGMQVGDEIEIVYLPAHKTEVFVPSSMGMATYTLSGGALIFGGVGVLMLVFGFVKSSSNKKFKANGKRITVRITDIAVDHSYRVNNNYASKFVGVEYNPNDDNAEYADISSNETDMSRSESDLGLKTHYESGSVFPKKFDMPSKLFADDYLLNDKYFFDLSSLRETPNNYDRIGE